MPQVPLLLEGERGGAGGKRSLTTSAAALLSWCVLAQSLLLRMRGLVCSL